MNNQQTVLTSTPAEYDIVSELTILSLALEGILSLSAHTVIEENDIAPLITMVNNMKKACKLELN